MGTRWEQHGGWPSLFSRSIRALNGEDNVMINEKFVNFDNMRVNRVLPHSAMTIARKSHRLLIRREDVPVLDSWYRNKAINCVAFNRNVRLSSFRSLFIWFPCGQLDYNTINIGAVWTEFLWKPTSRLRDWSTVGTWVVHRFGIQWGILIRNFRVVILANYYRRRQFKLFPIEGIAS